MMTTSMGININISMVTNTDMGMDSFVEPSPIQQKQPQGLEARSRICKTLDSQQAVGFAHVGRPHGLHRVVQLPCRAQGGARGRPLLLESGQQGGELLMERNVVHLALCRSIYRARGKEERGRGEGEWEGGSRESGASHRRLLPQTNGHIHKSSAVVPRGWGAHLWRGSHGAQRRTR